MTQTVFSLPKPPEAFGGLGPGQDRNQHGDHAPPLFAHECLGAYSPAGVAEDELEDQGGRRASQAVLEVEDYDDPRLERFPSNRNEIMDAVRKIETGLDEDHASFEGVPPSPVVGRSGRSMDELLETLPIAAMPTSPRVSKRLDRPRSPSDRSSAVSLQSISEADDEDHITPIVLSRAAVMEDKRVSKSPGSDEDEGVALKNIAGVPRRIAKLHESQTSQSHEPPATGDEVLALSSGVAKEDAANGLKEESPRIIVRAPAEEERAELADVEAHNDTVSAEQVATLGPENSAQLRKRRPGEVPTSAEDNSNQSEPPQASGRESWLSALFHSFFQNWIGPLVHRLCGTRHKK